MRIILAAIVLIATYAAHAAEPSQVKPAPCATVLVPVDATAPVLPAEIHNEFSGSAYVQYVVRENGTVSSPEILRAEWRATGNAAGEPVGYELAILEAVASWSFTPQPSACVNATTLEISVDHVGDPQAIRPNKSLKYVPALRASTGRS